MASDPDTVIERSKLPPAAQQQPSIATYSQAINNSKQPLNTTASSHMLSHTVEGRTQDEDSTTAQDKKEHKSHFSFLKLPSELRIKIYKIIVKCDEPIGPYLHRASPAHQLRPWQVASRVPSPFHPRALKKLSLEMNKAISAESIACLYHHNTFELSISTPIDRGFLNRIGRTNSNEIRSLRIILDGNPATTEKNLIDLQNTIVKRCNRNIEHLNYQIRGALPDAITPVQLLTTPAISRSWKKLKSLRQITVSITEGSAVQLDPTQYRILQRQAKVKIVGEKFQVTNGTFQYTKWLELD